MKIKVDIRFIGKDWQLFIGNEKRDWLASGEHKYDYSTLIVKRVGCLYYVRHYVSADQAKAYQDMLSDLDVDFEY